MNAQNGCKNESTTFVEGGLSGVLHFSRADDRKNAPIVAKIRVSRKFKLSFILKKYSFKLWVRTHSSSLLRTPMTLGLFAVCAAVPH